MKLCTKCGLNIPLDLCRKNPHCIECKKLKENERVRLGMQKYRKGLKEEFNGSIEFKGKQYLDIEYGLKLHDVTNRYNTWLSMIQRISKDYPRLTEAQWYEAVEYFNFSCALCHNNPVCTRYYFVVAKDGGMYCDWNILPVCDSCINHSNRNLFNFMSVLLHRHHAGKYSLKTLDYILSYLYPRLIKAIKWSNAQRGDDTSSKPVIK